MIQLNKLWILIILILFNSCYTVKKMNKQVVKGYTTYPVEFTQTVSNLLPVKEKDSTSISVKYIPGDTIKITKLIKADCDSIKPDSNGKRIVYLKGEDNYIHDTITNTITNIKVIEDTKKIITLTNQLNASNIQVSKKDTTINIMKWSLISLAGLFILLFFLRKIPFIKNII